MPTHVPSGPRPDYPRGHKKYPKVTTVCGKRSRKWADYGDIHLLANPCPECIQ